MLHEMCYEMLHEMWCETWLGMWHEAWGEMWKLQWRSLEMSQWGHGCYSPHRGGMLLQALATRPQPVMHTKQSLLVVSHQQLGSILQASTSHKGGS